MPVEPLKQPELFEPEHMSLHPDRLARGMPERVYLEHWQTLNRRSPGINHGFTALEWILTPSGRFPGPVSQRDAAVAASVVQWLGTNCGAGFLSEAERRIGANLHRPLVFPVTVYPTPNPTWRQQNATRRIIFDHD